MIFATVAFAQSSESAQNDVVIHGANGPLLRVVTRSEGMPDEDFGSATEGHSLPSDANDKKNGNEPPPASGAPQIPVSREPAGPNLPASSSAPLKASTRNDKSEELNEASPENAPLPEVISAERSKQLVKMSGSPSIDLAEIVSKLPKTEDIVQADELRVDEAVAFSLKNNFEVAAVRQKKIGSRWEEVGAFGQFFPRGELTRGVGKQRSTPAGYNDANDVRIPDSRHHYRERIWSVNFPIVDLGLISDLLSRHHIASAAAAEEQGVKEKVALDTVKGYYRLIMYSLHLQFAEEYKKQLDGLTERMAARVAGGGAAQAELDRVQARALMAQASIIDARNNLESTLFEFRRLTGVEAKKLVMPTNLLPYVPNDVEAIVKKAVVGNPDVLTAVYRANAAEFDIATFLNRSLPKLQFQLTSTRTYNSGGSAFDFNATDGGPFAYQNEKKAMLVLSWVFNPTVDLPQAMAGFAKSREEFYKTVDIRKRVDETVRTSYSAMQTAASRVDPMLQAVSSNEKVVVAFEAQYQNANRTVLDLLDAYDHLFQAKKDLVYIMVTEAVAGYQLRRQMGELVQAIVTIEDRDPSMILPEKVGSN
jgi:adhesin transport system outer membrane protein